jgi:hypothetical protein
MDQARLSKMPTELGEQFSITWRGDPPQMLPADIPLWQQFLNEYAATFLHFYYQVKVGGPDLTNIDASPEMKKMYYQATAKRIDAIAEKKDRIWIIEVASKPYLRAIGQILTYRYLWNQDPKIDKPPIDTILCWSIDKDLEMVLKHYRVQIVKLKPKPLTYAEQKAEHLTG